MAKIQIDEIRGLGHVNRQSLNAAITEAKRQCDIRTMPGVERIGCRNGVEFAAAQIAGREGVVDTPTSIVGRLSGAELGRLRAALKGPQIGVFFECALDCPEGWEKVILRKMNRKINPRTGEVTDRGRCVCRLDPKVRRKFTGKKYEQQTEEDRTPFGSEKKPVHLRRKHQDYAPGVTPRDIRKLR
jgi:hypothetical protein